MMTLALICLHWSHPFFVSVIDVRHNAADKNVEVSVKAFTDDMENALRQNFPGAKIDLMRSKAGPIEDSLIQKYVRQKLRLTINGKTTSLQYVGYERQEESVWMYFEIGGIATMSNLQVNTNLLYEYKAEQINIIHARSGEEQKSYRLSNPETAVSMQF